MKFTKLSAKFEAGTDAPEEVLDECVVNSSIPEELKPEVQEILDTSNAEVIEEISELIEDTQGADNAAAEIEIVTEGFISMFSNYTNIEKFGITSQTNEMLGLETYMSAVSPGQSLAGFESLSNVANKGALQSSVLLEIRKTLGNAVRKIIEVIKRFIKFIGRTVLGAVNLLRANTKIIKGLESQISKLPDIAASDVTLKDVLTYASFDGALSNNSNDEFKNVSALNKDIIDKMEVECKATAVAGYKLDKEAFSATLAPAFAKFATALGGVYSSEECAIKFVKSDYSRSSGAANNLGWSVDKVKSSFAAMKQVGDQIEGFSASQDKINNTLKAQITLLEGTIKTLGEEPSPLMSELLKYTNLQTKALNESMSIRLTACKTAQGVYLRVVKAFLAAARNPAKKD